MMVRVEADFSFCGLLQNIERFCVDSASSNTQIESKVLWGDGARARRGARALERAPGPTAAAAAAAAQEAAEPAASPAKLAVAASPTQQRRSSRWRAWRKGAMVRGTVLRSRGTGPHSALSATEPCGESSSWHTAKIILSLLEGTF